MGVEQHFVALGGVRLQDEGPAGAQFQVGSQDLAPDAADQQALFAPVELEGFAQFESQRYVGFGQRLPASLPPAPDKGGHPAVAAVKAGRLQFAKQFQRGAPVPLGAPGIHFQGFGQPLRERTNLGVVGRSPPILRFRSFCRPQPALDGVARVAAPPGYFRYRQAITVVPASNPSQFLHGNHRPIYPAQMLSSGG